ncbi:MAG: 5-formyltetrahydrofolate cyclo-ligase [Rhodospirillaceae bacterium]
MTDATPADPGSEKPALRAAAGEVRAAAHAGRADAAAAALADRFIAELAGRLQGGAVVSLFWSMRDEIGTRPLMAALAARGFALALPAMQGRDRPLVFRRWADGDVLVRGVFGVDEPAPSAPDLRPDIVCVPLLAFDAGGNRLGYGGGYYDRTLRALRDNGVVLAVGVAYDEQQMASVPACPWDEPLDMVVTDRRALRCPPPPRRRAGDEKGAEGREMKKVPKGGR